MKFEIISTGLGGNGEVVMIIEAEDKNDALNKFADIKGLAQNARSDLRWFDIRHSYAAGVMGTAKKNKDYAEKFAESLMPTGLYRTY